MSKDFNEFIKTITPEVHDQIAASVNKCNIKISSDPSEKDGTVSFFAGVNAANMITTIELLKHYHNWLNN